MMARKHLEIIPDSAGHTCVGGDVMSEIEIKNLIQEGLKRIEKKLEMMNGSSSLEIEKISNFKCIVNNLLTVASL